MQFQTQFYKTENFIRQKGAEKLVKDELCMLANAARYHFDGRYHFRLWVFASTGEYFTTETYYYPKCYKANDAKTFKNLEVSFYPLWSQIICILQMDLFN